MIDIFTIRPGHQQVPTTAPDNAKRQHNISNEFQSAEESFKAQRDSEMKTNNFPYRRKKGRYAAVLKCLDKRLKGGKFDYGVYLSCVGCITCEPKPMKQPEVKKIFSKPRKQMNGVEILKTRMRAISFLNRDFDIYN